MKGVTINMSPREIIHSYNSLQKRIAHSYLSKGSFYNTMEERDFELVKLHREMEMSAFWFSFTG